MEKALDRTTPRDPQATPGAPLPRARVPQLAHLGAGAGKPKAGGAADELTPEYMEEFRQALARGEALRYGSRVLKGAPVSAKAQTEANETGGPCHGKYGPPTTKGGFYGV